MLRELAIKNFAIIDDLRIRFENGLTILSGETGAGKSIIINAVNLLLGGRPSDKMIRTGSDTAELEALFEIRAEGPAAKLLQEMDADPEDGLIIRRVISNTNRHKVYINGRLSTLRQLVQLTENIASISGQHAHQGLLDENQHLEILDRFADTLPLREKVGKAHKALLPLIRNRKDLLAKQAHLGEQIETLQFQREEITSADISEDEDKALEEERLRLKNGESLYRSVYGAVDTLYDAQEALFPQLTAVGREMEKAAAIDKSLLSNAEAIADTAFRVEDIVEKLRDYLNTLQMDDRRLEEVASRIDKLTRLKRKYGGSLESVFDHLEKIEAELAGIENIDQEIEAADRAIELQRKRLIELAEKLSQQRKKAAKILSEKVVAELEDLKMPRTRFEILFSPLPAQENTDSALKTEEGNGIGKEGKDKVAFSIAPNVGEELKPLASIASGGELSRVVLALKAILVETESVETLIFDEVDAGVGGSVAEKVGEKLALLANYHQVICITHLAQIAKFGDHHFRIAKQVIEGRTRTDIEPLEKRERVEEIARMLGGNRMTQTTLDHATEMLGEGIKN